MLHIIETKELEKMNERRNFLQYVAENNIHRAIAVSVIKKFAATPFYYTEKGAMYNPSSDPCLDIVINGFKDDITEDIYSTVFIEIIALYDEGKVTLVKNEEGKNVLQFANYEDSNGKERSYYIRLYKAVRNALTECKGSISSNIGEIPFTDLTTEEIDGDFLEIALTRNAPDYVRQCAKQADFTDVINNVDFLSIMRYIKRNTSEKRYSTLCNVIYGMIRGMKAEEISRNYNISIPSVKFAKKEIRDHYAKYSHGITLTHKRRAPFALRSFYTMTASGFMPSYSGYNVGTMKPENIPSGTFTGFDLSVNRADYITARRASHKFGKELARRIARHEDITIKTRRASYSLDDIIQKARNDRNAARGMLYGMKPYTARDFRNTRVAIPVTILPSTDGKTVTTYRGKNVLHTYKIAK